jgi:hypothetical protein
VPSSRRLIAARPILDFHFSPQNTLSSVLLSQYPAAKEELSLGGFAAFSIPRREIFGDLLFAI